MGMVACPPHVAMFMFGEFRCSSRFTAGTTNGPIAAGVRSMSRFPYGDSELALARCALADVASKMMPMSLKQGRSISPRAPSAVVATLHLLALARPSESGSMPTIAAISSDDERSTFIIRSVPMFPEPITATLVVFTLCLSRECRGNLAERTDRRDDLRAGRHRDHGPERAGQHHVAGLQRRTVLPSDASQPQQCLQRVTQTCPAGACRCQR